MRSIKDRSLDEILTIMREEEDNFVFEELACVAVERLGFTTFGYAAIVDDYQARNFFGNFSQAWKDKYFKGDYKRLDAIIRHCRASDTPVNQAPAMEAVRDFFHHLPGLGVARANLEQFQFFQQMGYRNLYVTPVVREYQGRKIRAAIYISTPGSDQEFLDMVQQHRADLMRVFYIIHEVAVTKFHEYYYKTGILDVVDQKIMALLGEGKTNPEVAASLGTTDRTIRNRLQRLKEEFDVKTTVQLYRILMLKGLLNDDLQVERRTITT